MDTKSLNRLLRSESRSSHMIGLIVCATIFMPSVFDAIDQPDLTIWQRLKIVTIAAGQTLGTIGLAGLPPEVLMDRSDDQKSGEE